MPHHCALIVNRSTVCVLWMLWVAALVGGCDSPSSMFTGIWELPGHEEVSTLGGWPKIAMGHYGHEVAGVTYLRAENSTVAPPLSHCPCVWIDHYRVDLTRAEVEFTTRCEVGAGEVEAATLHWILKFQVDEETGDDLLVGTVAPEGEKPPTEPNLRLVRTQVFLGQEDKECTPGDKEEP